MPDGFRTFTFVYCSRFIRAICTDDNMAAIGRAICKAEYATVSVFLDNADPSKPYMLFDPQELDD